MARSSLKTKVIVQSLENTFGGTLNIKSLGALGDGVTDDSAVIRSAIVSLKTVGGGVIFFPAGVYRIATDLIYDITRLQGPIRFIGEGQFTNPYEPTASGGSVLFFDGANFDDGLSDQPDWNTAKGVMLFIEQMGLVFNGVLGEGEGEEATESKGFWKAPFTLPLLTNVAILIKGSYDDSPIINFYGSGPIGKTCTWRDVDFYPQWSSGDYLMGIRVHFDSFLWQGGGIGTKWGVSVVEPRMMYIDAVSYAEMNKIIVYRDDEIPAKFYFVGLTEVNSAIRFTDCHVAYPAADSTIAHIVGYPEEVNVIVDRCNWEDIDGNSTLISSNVVVLTAQYAAEGGT